MLVIVAACSNGPHLSDDGRWIHRVSDLVASLERSYQRENLSGLLAGMAPTMPGREAVREAAEAAFARYDRIDLALTVDRIHLDGPTATVFLHWDGRWGTPDSDDGMVRQGAARFVVASGEPLLVSDILGDSPFVPASRP